MRILTRLLAVSVLVLALTACGSDDDEPAAAETTTTATTEATTETGVTGQCEVVEAPDPKQDGGQTAPTKELDAGQTYLLELETSCGSFTITLDQKSAPKTAASLVALAEAGFYDGTVFHRVVPGFVIQGGDPTGTGTGGPGYQTVDPPPQDARYTKGVVAMAKAATEAPGTSGSQFFVVTGEDIGLPPDYAVVGKVTEGLETVLAVDHLGVQDGPPSMPVVIEQVSVEER
ncbi:MAG: peptidylprolyl isomerase [Actinobacteria bacterium]|nr:peptidylprolyl isomerase [Actinomycetota bacterium]